MNRILSGLAAALALGVGISASVLADQGTAPDQSKWHGGGRGPFAQLNLTDDQKSQMKALHEQQRDQMKNTFQALRDAHQQLRAQVFSDNPDNAQIATLQTKIAGLEKDALSARIDMDRKISAILTPDQRKTMATLPAFGHGGWGHHGHHRGGNGGPGGSGGPGGPGGSSSPDGSAPTQP